HIVEDVRELCSQMAIIDRGRVLMSGDPRKFAAELEGKVWRKSIEKDRVEAYEASMKVISKRLLAGRPSIHILSDTPPGDGFEAVAPDLEDVYLAAIEAGS
ncbi:MAG: ABC transporter ATP-binding protein, partial [bacterium]